MSTSLDFYLSKNKSVKAEYNVKIVDALLEFFFNFSYVECIETGVSCDRNDDDFGIYLAKFTETYGGKMTSVDIDSDKVEKSINLIRGTSPNLIYKSVCQDSIDFLKEYEGQPNLVHLDSYDLDINNPLPSMLHHWLEFVEIKDKMPSGSILLIDDNFFRGTVVYWSTLDGNGEIVNTVDVDINYDVIGKGSMIYHAVKEKRLKDWELLGDHYHGGPNHKLILRKL